MLITTEELAALRTTLMQAMSDTAAFQRRSDQLNSMGGRSSKPVDVPGMDAVPCHVFPDDQRSVDEGERAGRVSAVERYRIVFPWDTDARTSDVVTVRDRRYELVKVDIARSDQLEVEALAVRES